MLLAGLLVGTSWADEVLNKALLDYRTYSDTAMVRELISKGADVNVKNSDGFVPLYWAVSYGTKEAVELLITKGANVNSKISGGDSPLRRAASEGKKEVAELLISKGADVNVKNDDDGTPLHYAATGDIAELLISKGADVNSKNKIGCTPLWSAVYGGRKEVAKLLISKGANVNAEAEHFQDNTPLHVAAEHVKKEFAELLIASGADINAKAYAGQTPLDYAVNTKYYDATEKKKNEVVALLQAAMQKQEEMAALLQTALQNQAGNQRETFNRVMANYKDRTMSDAIRRPFIALAAKLKPAPAVSEEARKYLVRGNTLMGYAKNPGEARSAIQEYQNALLAAPWWDDAYYNLAKAQELAGDLNGAVSSMQYYILTEPQDKRDAQDRLYAIEAKRDKAKWK